MGLDFLISWAFEVLIDSGTKFLGSLIDDKRGGEIQKVYVDSVKAWTQNDKARTRFLTEKRNAVGALFIDFTRNPNFFKEYEGEEKSLFVVYREKLLANDTARQIIADFQRENLLAILNNHLPTDINADQTEFLLQHSLDVQNKLQNYLRVKFYHRVFELKPFNPSIIEKEYLKYEEFKGKILNKKLNMIIAGGGLGKSTILAHLTHEILKIEGESPLIYYFKGDDFNGEKYDEIFGNNSLKCLERDKCLKTLNSLASCFGINLTTHEVIALLNTKKVDLIVVLDGLNEIIDESYRKDIIRLLEDVNDLTNSTIIASSRSRDKNLIKPWNIYQVHSLERPEVENVFEGHLNKKIQEIDESTQELLKIPFFLDRIDLDDMRIKSFSSFINAHLLKNIRGYDKKEEALFVLSEFALKCYERNKIFKISRKDIPEDFCVEDYKKWGILFENEGLFSFEHQLFIELLVANKISRTPSKWTEEYFDLITKNSENSFEVIQMILEQVSNSEQGDKFLLKLYNWSFYAVLHCLKNVEDNYNYLSVKAILLVLLEKLFDRFFHTRKNVLKHLAPILQKFDIKVQGNYVENCLNNYEPYPDMKIYFNTISNYIEEYKGTEYYDWFKRFVDSSSVDKDLIVKISTEQNPVMSWGYSNLLKRIEMEPNHELILWAIFKSNSGDINKIIRWRVVHTLGNSRTELSQTLLTQTLKDESEYPWVRFGAARSLMELYFFREKSGILEDIFEILENYQVDEVINKELIKCLSHPLGKEKEIRNFIKRIENSTKIDSYRRENWLKSYVG